MSKKPLIIKNSTGEIIDLLNMNEKSFNKSVENSTIWFVDSKTDRVLPYNENIKFIELKEEKNFYVATIEKTVKKEKKSGAQKNLKLLEDDNIIELLTKTIKQRKKEMPEGSYTTYLFGKGEEKIKKKLGEEAIEILLAKNDDEIVCESADFVYHLLVFLESRNLNFNNVLNELKKRDK